MRGKIIILSCNDCGKRVWFEGKDIDDIIKKIDISGWRDLLDGALCPECDKKRDEEYKS